MLLTRALRSPWAVFAGSLALTLYFAWLLFFLAGLLPPEPTAPAAKAPALLKLNDQGILLDADSGSRLADTAVPQLLRSGRTDQPLIFMAPATLSYGRIFQVLRLCQAAGRERQELRLGDETGIVVRLHSSRQLPVMPDNVSPSDDDLTLRNHVTVMIRTKGNGEVGPVLVRSTDGEVVLPEALDLPRYLRHRVEEIHAQDVANIVGDPELIYGGLLDILRYCREAGYQDLRLAMSRR